MDINDIKWLSVSSIADKDAILFLWCTFPLLQEGLDTLRLWGFEYRTLGFSWIKTNKNDGKPFFGIGYYTKSNCEVCLIGVRGDGAALKKSDKVSSVIIAPRESHSKKPDIVREKIVEFCGDIPRIELFARKKYEGWDTWGNEVKSDIELT